MMQAASTCAECGRAYCETAGAREAAAISAARAEGEAAGRAAERAAVVVYLRDHRDVADRRGGQQVDAGPNPAVRRWVLREAVPDIMNGAHVAGDGAAAAQAELAQARADLRVMAGLSWEGISDRFTFSPTTIGDAVIAGVEAAEDAVQGMPDADVLAAVRRALGVA